MNPLPHLEPEDGRSRHLLPSPAAWFWIAIFGSFVALTLLGIDITLRASLQDRPAMIFMEKLGLSQPALLPAASPQRLPEARHPAVDLRYSPDVSHRLEPVHPLFFFEERQEGEPVPK
jgi:hypothetical protein